MRKFKVRKNANFKKLIIIIRIATCDKFRAVLLTNKRSHWNILRAHVSIFRQKYPNAWKNRLLLLMKLFRSYGHEILHNMNVTHEQNPSHLNLSMPRENKGCKWNLIRDHWWFDQYTNGNGQAISLHSHGWNGLEMHVYACGKLKNCHKYPSIATHDAIFPI